MVGSGYAFHAIFFLPTKYHPLEWHIQTLNNRFLLKKMLVLVDFVSCWRPLKLTVGEMMCAVDFAAAKSVGVETDDCFAE